MQRILLNDETSINSTLMNLIAFKQISFWGAAMRRPQGGRDAGAMVGQGGRRGTRGHSGPKASEVSRKFGVWESSMGNF